MGQLTYSERDRRSIFVMHALHTNTCKRARLRAPVFTNEDMRLHAILGEVDPTDDLCMEAWEEFVWRVAVARRERTINANAREGRPTSSLSMFPTNRPRRPTIRVSEPSLERFASSAERTDRTLTLRDFEREGRTLASSSSRMLNSHRSMLSHLDRRRERERGSEPASGEGAESTSIFPTFQPWLPGLATPTGGQGDVEDDVRRILGEGAASRAAPSGEGEGSSSTANDEGGEPSYPRDLLRSTVGRLEENYRRLETNARRLETNAQRLETNAQRLAGLETNASLLEQTRPPSWWRLRGLYGHDEPPMRLSPAPRERRARSQSRSSSPDDASRAWLEEYTASRPNRRRREDSPGPTLRRTRRRISDMLQADLDDHMARHRSDTGRDRRRDGIVFGTPPLPPDDDEGEGGDAGDGNAAHDSDLPAVNGDGMYLERTLAALDSSTARPSRRIGLLRRHDIDAAREAFRGAEGAGILASDDDDDDDGDEHLLLGGGTLL